MAISPPKPSPEDGEGAEKEPRDFDHLTLQILLVLAIAWAAGFVAVAAFDADMPEALKTVFLSPFLLLSVVVASVVSGAVFVPPGVALCERALNWLRASRNRDDHRGMLAKAIWGVSAAIVGVALYYVVVLVIAQEGPL